MSVKRLRRRIVFITAGCAVGLALAVASVVALVASDEGLRTPTRPGTKAPELEAITIPLDPRDLVKDWARFSEGGGLAAARQAPAGLELTIDARAAKGVTTTGVRSRFAFPLGDGLAFRTRLDWRAPGNSSYRAAGILVATESEAPLSDLKPAVRLEVIGVPPGRTARLHGAIRTGLRERTLFDDGWPAKKEGRQVGAIELVIELWPGEVVLRADGVELARVNESLAGSFRAYLFTSSHENYAERPVTFESVAVVRARRPHGRGGRA